MSGGLVLLLPLVAAMVVLAAVLVAVPRRRKLVAINERDFPELARLRGVNAIARAVGVVVGLLAVAAFVGSGRFGLGILLAPAVFAGTQILAALGAGIITRNASRTKGTAGLEVRRIRPYLPGALTVVAGSVTAMLGLALVWTTVVAGPDDRGFAGRAISYSYTCDDTVCTSTSTPWPGSFYSIPLGVLLAGVLVLAALAIVVTVRRPRDASDPEIVRVDNHVRARGVESVVAAVGLASAATLFAVSFLVSSVLADPYDVVPLHLRIPGWGAVVVAGAALATTVWCAVVLLLPGGTVPLHTDERAATRASRVIS